MSREIFWYGTTIYRNIDTFIANLLILLELNFSKIIQLSKMSLTDLGMPGMSGWEVGRAIKQMSPDTPVGMITGWEMEVDQAKIKENAIDFVIPKPFQFNQILKVIEETIASKAKPLMT